MKHETATGPDEIPSKLLKTAGNSIVPSLMTFFKMSATMATLPQEWKLARKAAVHKKEDETVRDNYRTLSMLCIPSKLIEKQVATNITGQIQKKTGLLNSYQWAYKKNHSTEQRNYSYIW